MRSFVIGAILTPLLAVTAQAQHGAHPAVQPPQVGKMIDAQRTLRPVSGIAGNFLTGPGEAQGVSTFACSAQACVTASDPRVLATDGKRVVAYLPQSNAFAGWNLGGRAAGQEPLAWNPLLPGDEVLSIRITSAGADVAIRRAGAVEIVAQDGTLIDTLPSGATGPVLLFAAGSLYAGDDAVVLRRPDGTTISFPTSGVEALYSMSPDWVEAVAGNTLYAIRTTPGREALYGLPGGRQ